MTPAPFAAPRRIVAGMNADGRSYFARVEEVGEVDYPVNYPRHAAKPEKDIEIYRIWGADQLPIELPDDGTRAPLQDAPSADETHLAMRRSSPHPPVADGFRITMLKMHPGRGSSPERSYHLHWHDTFDCQWLAAGQLAVSMDDGSEVIMQPGDALLQYGTNHAWRVVGDEVAVIYLFMLGARRVGPTPPIECRVVARPG
ncbi:MAG TPA: hypothetical protein VNQ73_03765 [Ilumatobacter sp.]|nr:hypothetical protein [Ilumatobacter sp.]